MSNNWTIDVSEQRFDDSEQCFVGSEPCFDNIIKQYIIIQRIIDCCHSID